jgi:hypothetical protein
VIAAVLLSVLALGENRAWKLAIELEGPLEEARLECGADGTTRLVGPLLEGERRALEVPIPVRSPLGATALMELPFPHLVTVPAEAAQRCRIAGWRPAEEEALRSAGPGLLARPRPPAPGGQGPRPGPAEGLLAVLVLVLLLRLRGRPWFQAVAGLGGGVVLGLLARSRPAAGPARTILEVDPAAAVALRVTVARDRLAIENHLEVLPQGGALELLVSLEDGQAHALAPGRALVSIATVAAPALEPQRNDWGDLERAWSRSAPGARRPPGAWPRGQPVQRALGPLQDTTSPPGWLASALPPGREVLLARAGEGTWVRVLGFPALRESDPAGD